MRTIGKITLWLTASIFTLPLSAQNGALTPVSEGEPTQKRGESAGKPVGATVVPGSDAKSIAVVITRIVNGSKNPVRNPSIHMFTPLDLPHQDIHELEIEGDASTTTDEWGNRLASYKTDVLAPGRSFSGRWSANFTMRRFQWNLSGNGHDNVAALPPTERELHLRDARHFDIGNEQLRATLERATQDHRKDDLGQITGIFDHLAGTLRYKMDGKWDAAPQVLATGEGSCSEFTFCFIAMCRARGIPARYLGGINGKQNVPFHFDLTNHRFPQSFCPGFGWVDFDPTWSSNSRNKRSYFGQTPGPMLLLCRGDGTNAPLTGTSYVSSTRWNGGGKETSWVRHAWWLPAPPPEIERQVIEFRKQMLTLPGERQGEAISMALRIGHPMVLPWLDDLLYDSRWRTEATRAALRIGGPPALESVIDSIGRMGDSSGDLAVTDVLNTYTGQNLPPQRNPWFHWYGNRNPSVRLPGQQNQ